MMADRIIAVSNITKGIIVHKYHIPADKIEVVHNAIDASSLINYDYDRRTYKYLELLKDEGYTVVSTVTRFTAQKGLVQLMRGFAKACQQHDRFAFLLAGDGEQRDELSRAMAGLSAPARACIEAVYFRALTHRQAAQALGMPLGTVKTHVRNGIAHLRGALEGT